MTQTYPLATEGLPGPTGRSYWVIEDRLAAGAYPGKKGRWELERVPEVVEQLLGAGIDRFVNLTQDYPGGTDGHLTHYDSDVEPHAKVGRFGIRDVYIPTEELMVEILDAIDDDLAAGHNVYAHCWGGVGRTGTVVGCWLIRHGYATAGDVLEVITDLRIGDVGRGPNAGPGRARVSPETPEQFDFVVGWEQGR
jgi:protein-tyrosine phosphatase